MKVVLASVLCMMGVCKGSVIPPGLSEPLTKMAEEMAKLSHGNGRAVQAQLEADAKSRLAGQLSFLQKSAVSSVNDLSSQVAQGGAAAGYSD